jgi:hypothetical protein
MLLSEICGLVSVGRPLWRDDGSGVCNAVTQWSESHRTRNHVLLSHLRLPQPRGPDSRICNPQEQGGPFMTLGTGFTLRRLLRLAGLRWRYSNPPPHGISRPHSLELIFPFLTEPKVQACPTLHRSMETYPVSKTLCVLYFRLQDDGISNLEWCIPSSEAHTIEPLHGYELVPPYLRLKKRTSEPKLHNSRLWSSPPCIGFLFRKYPKLISGITMEAFLLFSQDQSFSVKYVARRLKLHCLSQTDMLLIE